MSIPINRTPPEANRSTSSGDNFTSPLAYTLWQGGDIKGNGICSQQSCPVSFNNQSLYARRSRLQLPGGALLPTGPGGQINQTLRRGDSGPDVSRLQDALNRNGASLTVDGNYGSGTESAVLRYQQSKNLTADGTAGPQTLRSLGL